MIAPPVVLKAVAPIEVRWNLLAVLLVIAETAARCVEHPFDLRLNRKPVFRSFCFACLMWSLIAAALAVRAEVVHPLRSFFLLEEFKPNRLEVNHIVREMRFGMI